MFTILSLAGLLLMQMPDTIQTVTVVADRGVIVSRTDTLSIDKSATITEVLQQSPSLYLNDYGGFAGLKSVSLRGMGSPHTAIYVDGVRVGNVQIGQGDLALLGIENFGSVVIDYAQSSVSFLTQSPSLQGAKAGGNAKISAGSFGTYLPYGRIDWKMSDKMTASANVAGVISDGDFPCSDGSKRVNNDIKQLRGGMDLFGLMDGGSWHTKMFLSSSKRGTPGTLSRPSTDRQEDRNIFVQCLMKKQLGPRYSLTASAKAAYDGISYTSEWGDSNYSQTEFQLNSTSRFDLRRWLTLSATANVAYDNLSSTVYDQRRFGATGAFSAAASAGRWRAVGAVLYEGAFDKGQSGKRAFSPSIDIKGHIAEGLEVSAFARRAYRIPTFNELYYTGYGNPDLKCEDATLGGVGLDWRKCFGSCTVKTKLDGFSNCVTDKINSAPSPEDPAIWYPYNIGEVHSWGADVLVGASWSKSLSLSAKYTFQNATDRTEGSSGGQIAYIPKHSLSLNASASLKSWKADAAWNLRAGRKDAYGDLPSWNTLDASVSRDFSLGRVGTFTFRLAGKNLTDTRYELSSGYPMAPRSFLCGMELSF